MKKNKNIVWLAAFVALWIAAPAFANPGSWGDWQHGALGHERAFATAERYDEPLVVYFHTEWCPWCLKLNDRYLRNGPVRQVLAGMRKVEINPERGSAEHALFKDYRGTGYPSFYVTIPASGMRAIKITPFQQSREQSLPEFSERIRKAATDQYNLWAEQLFSAGDSAGSTRILERALAYNARNAYAHFLQGIIHRKAAYEARDANLLRQAVAAFERALAIDPADSRSREALDAVRALLDG